LKLAKELEACEGDDDDDPKKKKKAAPKGDEE
jgi:hypothetical protein